MYLFRYDIKSTLDHCKIGAEEVEMISRIDTKANLRVLNLSMNCLKKVTIIYLVST